MEFLNMISIVHAKLFVMNSSDFWSSHWLALNYIWCTWALIKWTLLFARLNKLVAYVLTRGSSDSRHNGNNYASESKKHENSFQQVLMIRKRKLRKVNILKQRLLQKTTKALTENTEIINFNIYRRICLQKQPVA